MTLPLRCFGQGCNYQMRSSSGTSAPSSAGQSSRSASSAPRRRQEDGPHASNFELEARSIAARRHSNRFRLSFERHAKRSKNKAGNEVDNLKHHSEEQAQTGKEGLPLVARDLHDLRRHLPVPERPPHASAPDAPIEIAGQWLLADNRHARALKRLSVTALSYPTQP